MKIIKQIFYLVFALNTLQIFAQNTDGSSSPRVSIISADAIFIDTVITKSYNRNIPGSKYVQHVITDHKTLLYDLKISLIIHDLNNNTRIPLGIKLTSSTNEISIYHIEEDMSEFGLERIYYYEGEINLKEGGWYTLEVGEFNEVTDEEISTNKIYDKTQIYFTR